MDAPDLGYAEERMVERMMELRNREVGMPEAEARQFVLGFVRLMTAASRGDVGPRDEYLATVIPGLRESQFPLEGVIDAMMRVATAAVLAVEPAHVPWVNDFCAGYSARLIRVWNEE